MSENIITTGEFVKRPNSEGVYMKHFFSSADNDRLNNVEVKVEPGGELPAHIHSDSTEFYYVVEGTGEFLLEGKWHPIQKGYAFKAPMGVEHGVRNNGSEVLYLFSTFSPPIR